MEKERNLKKRTFQFSINCINLTNGLPNSFLGNHIKGQLIRCSSSVAANYRAALLAHSTAAFTSKLSIVVEEADESVFWMELIKNFGLINNKELEFLESEGKELVSIFVASRKKLQNRRFKN